MPRFVYVSPYDSQGRPSAIDPFLAMTVSNELKQEIDETLPGGSNNVSESRPQWLRPASLKLRAAATVNYTFLDEGAGYRNVVGFYTYPKSQPPRYFSQVQDVVVLVPNASKSGSGGGMNPGDTLRLPATYTTAQIGGRTFISAVTSYTFPADTVVCFLLASNRWRGSYVHENTNMFSSDPWMNPEPENLKVHCVSYRSKVNPTLLIMGWEDVNRTIGWCDHDFNDNVFTVKVEPFSALDDDCFNDGTTQSYRGTVLCEDLKGPTARHDRDYNDLNGEYHFVESLDNQGKLVGLEASFVFKHRGAHYDHNFGFILPRVHHIADAVITRETHQGETGEHVVTDMSQAVRDSGSDRIAFTESTRTLVTDGSQWANTQNENVVPSISKIKIEFPTPIDLDYLKNAHPPYSWYLRCYRRPDTRNERRTHELFSGTKYDFHSAETGSTTFDKILVLPNIVNFECPREKIALVHAYGMLRRFLQTGNDKFRYWYKDNWDKRVVVGSPTIPDTLGWTTTFAHV